VDRWKQLDPIKRLGSALEAQGLADGAELRQIEAEVQAELGAAIAFAEESPDAEAGDYLQYITAEAPHA
jgi:TPP-dependent pyruvate/acetoin dehydrogenase alpha subunit